MIRVATLDDLESVLKLEQTFGAEAFTKKSLRHFIMIGSTLILEENEPIGYSIVLFRKRSTLARLYSIAIAEPYQGKGYGRLLLESSESFAIAKGCDRMGLEVSENNVPARSLYEARGYGGARRLSWGYNDGSAALRLSRSF